MLEESRFNKRLHKLADVLYKLFEFFIASFFKEIRRKTHCVIDSFSVSIC